MKDQNVKRGQFYPRLDFPERKAIRAKLIIEYCRWAGYPGCVCFSCGNASSALASTGFPTLDISPTGTLVARGWWKPDKIHATWPHLFDATSGHLPMHMLKRLAGEFYLALGNLPERAYTVPTGSGETILALTIAYPHIYLVADYGTGIQGALYEPEAPLNNVVEALCETRFG